MFRIAFFFFSITYLFHSHGVVHLSLHSSYIPSFQLNTCMMLNMSIRSNAFSLPAFIYTYATLDALSRRHTHTLLANHSPIVTHQLFPGLSRYKASIYTHSSRIYTVPFHYFDSYITRCEPKCFLDSQRKYIYI